MTEKQIDALPKKLIGWCCLLLGYGFLLRAVFGFMFASSQDEHLKNGVAALVSTSSILLAVAIRGVQTK
jgi:hypothetical protein